MMFAPYIKERLPFLEEYFSLLIDSNKVNFPQSIIFYGEDTLVQYMLALNLAKILNCENDRTTHCNCLNCKWITENNHPAITTVSKIDFKPEDDGTKTVISVKQTQEIKNTLSVSSEYHRFFILCDADIKIPNAEELEKIKIFKQNKFSLPYDDEPEYGGKCWIPKGITKKVFQEESANSMLKSIEEPPPRTTFVFLSKDKNDLIETIISRSQCFYVPSVHENDENTEIVDTELRFYPEIDRTEINNLAAKILANGEAQNLTPEEIFTKIQLFIRKTVLANTNKPELVTKMLDDIRIINDAQAHMRAYIKPLPALENALFCIYKNWT